MSKFTVTEDAQRPASMNGKCVYCQEPIGGTHKDSCVMVRKRVKVRAIVEYEVEVPSAWGKELIEFQRNEGSWCADNMIDELSDVANRDVCLCGCTKFEYIEDTSEAFLPEK